MTPRSALWLAKAAKEAYAPHDGYPPPEGSVIRHAAAGNFEVLLVQCGGDTVVAFRGSDEPLDWRYNLKFYPLRQDGLPGRWHRGFWRGAVNLWPIVREAFALTRQDGRVWLVGHSLGGALAATTAALVARNGLSGRVGAVLQLGAPRAATRAGAAYLEARYAGRWWRAELPADRVTHVPAALLGFRHVGRKIKMPPLVPLADWAATILGDHGIERYLLALEECRSVPCFEFGPETAGNARELPARC